MYPSLDKLLPPLKKEYAKITRQAMWRCGKQKAKQKGAATAKASMDSSVNTGSIETPAPATSLRPSPSIARGAPKARKSKSHKTPKQQKRQRLEQLYNGYKLLEGDQGLVIEDSKGVPLLVVVRNVLPPNYNVSSLHCCQ
jgi:hypothetical protein